MTKKNEKHLQSLKIFYVNINGWSSQKIQHSDVIADIDNADIICLTETHLRNEEEFPVIENYDAFHSLVNRNNYIGRNIKGVSIYFKDNLHNTNIEELINEKGNLMILKITNSEWTQIDELFLLICYKEDRESKYKTDNYFENIQQHIIDQKMRHIILIGDLNGRIGTMNDNGSLKLIPRKSDDLAINGPGKEIIKFCNETSLIITNGRLENGNCTYFTLYKNEIKKSVIDYLILSESMFNSISDFKISEPVTYTDHAPMHINITQEIRACTVHRPTPKRSLYERKKYPFKWTNSYITSLEMDKFKESCKRLNEDINHNYLQNEIIFNTLIHNNNEAMPQTQKKLKSNDIIYSESTRKSRQQYKRSVLIYKENRTVENLKSLLRAKKDFNKELKKERRRNKNNKLNELNKAKVANDAKRYWQLINQNKRKKRKTEPKIKAIDFKKQIETRDLQMNESLKIKEDEIISYSDLMNKDPENILSSDITLEEVSKTLKSMKNSKSSGPDGLVNEILKNNFQETAPILAKIFNNIQNGDDIPWSSSWILPIYKAGSKDNLSSYRCINLSSCVEKLLTKIINNRLTKWFEKWKILNKEQTGFRKGNSVIDNALVDTSCKKSKNLAQDSCEYSARIFGFWQDSCARTYSINARLRQVCKICSNYRKISCTKEAAETQDLQDYWQDIFNDSTA